MDKSWGCAVTSHLPGPMETSNIDVVATSTIVGIVRFLVGDCNGSSFHPLPLLIRQCLPSSNLRNQTGSKLSKL